MKSKDLVHSKVKDDDNSDQVFHHFPIFMFHFVK